MTTARATPSDGSTVLPTVVGGGLPRRRQLLGGALAILGGPVLTIVLSSFRSDESITSDVLSYQLLVVVVAMVGGLWPALFAAVLSSLTLDYFFVKPLHTISISEPLHILALAIYTLTAVLVSVVVDRAARRARTAERAAAESEMLSTIAGSVLRGEDTVQAILDQTRQSFRLDGVALVESSERSRSDAPGVETIPIGDAFLLELRGRVVAPSDRRVLGVVVAQLSAAMERKDLSEVAGRVEPIEQADRVRSALLAAVGHDLRRPLAAATASVTSLRSSEVELSSTDRDDLLQTAEESLSALDRLVTDLLDVSRVEAGVLAVSLSSVDVAEVVLESLGELEVGPGGVDVDVPDALPEATADAVLLTRVVVNLVSNALRFSPAGAIPRVVVNGTQSTVEIRVIDEGPGIPETRRAEVFLPFQRLGDTDNTTGVGLGLALARGFVDGMGGRLRAEDTPGGGLTMIVELPASTPAAVSDSSTTTPAPAAAPQEEHE